MNDTSRSTRIICHLDHKPFEEGDAVERLTLRDPWIELAGDRVLGPNPPIYVHAGEGVRMDKTHEVVASGTVKDLMDRP